MKFIQSRLSVFLLLVIAILLLSLWLYYRSKFLDITLTPEQIAVVTMTAGGGHSSLEGSPSMRLRVERRDGDTPIENDTHPAVLFVRGIIKVHEESSFQRLVEKYCADVRELASELLKAQTKTTPWGRSDISSAPKFIDMMVWSEDKLYVRVLVRGKHLSSHILVLRKEGEDGDGNWCEIPTQIFSQSENKIAVALSGFPIPEKYITQAYIVP